MMTHPIHFGQMTVQWNRARPPRAMGRTEVFIRMAVYHLIHLLYCCMHPVGTLYRIAFRVLSASRHVLLPEATKSMTDIALAVELIATKSELRGTTNNA